MKQEIVSPLHRVAGRIARQLVTERLLADEHGCERVLQAELDRQHIADADRLRVVELIVELVGADARPLEPEPSR